MVRLGRYSTSAVAVFDRSSRIAAGWAATTTQRFNCRHPNEFTASLAVNQYVAPDQLSNQTVGVQQQDGEKLMEATVLLHPS